jgi:branched-chain amino acid transport system ATP-binding protein
MNILLEVNRLTKIFGGLAAVSEVDLSVADSEILGLIGPNGAGKTTFFNVIRDRADFSGVNLIHEDFSS